MLVTDYSKGPLPAAYGQVVRGIFDLKPLGIVVLSNRDSASWATRLKPPYRAGVQRGGGEGRPPLVEVNGHGLDDVLSAGGVDVAQVRADTTMVVRDAPGLKVMLDLKQEVLKTSTAPNTIGILEGSDPKLKGEYLVYSGHMDHIGHLVRQGRQHQQRRRRRRVRHRGRHRDGRGLQPPRRPTKRSSSSSP